MVSNQGFDANAGGTPIEPGTTVYDVNGDKIGSVEDITGDTLLIKKGLIFPKDISVPLAAVRQASSDGIYLQVTKDQVQQEDWGDFTGGRQRGAAVRPAASSAQTDIGTNRSGAARTDATIAGNSGNGEMTVPVHEEELVADKERGQIGQVHVHKDVVEERQTVSEPVMRERVHVEFEPTDDTAPADAATTPGAFQSQDVDVPVMGEQLNVEKQARTTGQVRLQKEQTTEQQQTSGNVRKERVNIEGNDGLVERDDPNSPPTRP